MKTSYLTQQLKLAQRTLATDTKYLAEAQRSVKSCTLELEELDRLLALAKMPGVIAGLKYDRAETRNDLRNAKDEVRSYSNDLNVDRSLIADIKRDLDALKKVGTK